MRISILIIALLVFPLSGCSFFGYHKQRKAQWAPPGEAEKVKFPGSFKDGVHLTGPMMAALEVAMNEFLPPGEEVKTNDPDKRVAHCLSRRSTYDTHVLQASEDLFFVWFSPNLARCGLDEPILDGGAVYAVDGQGRILDMR